MTAPAPTVVVLGGGTAGWMAACLLARAWPAASVTVVESPAVGIVGVGEGSTPQLRHLFAGLGLDEAAWMPAAHATYKVGIRFDGWSGDADDGYFHPFAGAVDLHTEPAFHAAALARRTGRDVPAHPDRFFLNSWLARHGRAPLADRRFPFDVGYGYHFDAQLIGEVLAREAARRGVRRLAAHVAQVAVGLDGQVAHLVTDDGGRIAGDLFVDASGFRSLIARGALGVPFRSFRENLFADAAVVVPTPPAADEPANHTTATALDHGWAWRIPLTRRVGNGYVYSTAHCPPDRAEAELRTHLGLGGDGPPARHLRFEVGRLERSWAGNCLAVGLAQGFLEPLEATALHLAQATVEGFVQAWTDGGGAPRRRDAFNAAIARRYDGVRDYIVAHYRMAGRRDTEFWRDNAANDRLSDPLKAMMTCWFTGGDLAAEVARLDIGRYYAPLSWGCLFAGYRVWPDARRLRPAPPHDDGIDDFLDRCGLNFGDHRAALAALAA